MHDSAYNECRQFLADYRTGTGPVLDVGSYDINGTLKPLFEGRDYTGLDRCAGPNVDLVAPARPWPLADASFDLVVSSSALEHDPAPWLTFLEMARVLKPGGHLYACAPSAGAYHGYPGDCWRFMRDAWAALAEATPGLKLLRGYTNHVKPWSDSVGIFQKDRAEPLPLDVDVILVKYGRDEQWERTTAAMRATGARLITRDNTRDNIGLVAARIELAARSTAPFIVFMDYDFTAIEVDLQGMAAHCSRMCQTGDGGEGVTVATAFPCHFMMFRRPAYEEAGGFHSAYHTAYADWDLINRIGEVVQHNPSKVAHLGSPGTKEKRALWAADRAIYNARWAAPPAKLRSSLPS